jgi:hypothetical protein|tara:strand:- start:124 stop:426 length:303 start_codon:yes stop_codon:yes gene_type:complete
MPRYDFLNTKTKEYFDEIMSYEEKVQYLKDNPHIEPANYLSMNVVGGVTKSEKGDSGMREVFSKIAEKHPTSPLADRYGKKSIRKLKAKRAYDKHKKRNP